MSVLSVRINGKDYKVACGDGEEERLQALAADVDDRIQSIVFPMKSKPSEAMAMLLAALMMSDELTEKQKEIDNLQLELRRAQARANIRRDDTPDARLAEMEAAMAATMEEIAARIEKIADEIEA